MGCSRATEQSPKSKRRAGCPSPATFNRQQPRVCGNKIPNQERVNKEVLISPKKKNNLSTHHLKIGRGNPRAKTVKNGEEQVC